MARLTLTDRDDQTLPGLCMFCGEAATKLARRRFAWHPPWVWLLLPAFVLPAALLAFVLTRKATIRVPACDWHVGAWDRRGWVNVASVLVLVAFGMAVMVTANLLNLRRDLAGLLCGGWLLLLVAFRVADLALGSRSVRPVRIRKGEITLAGVHPLFVAAYRDGLEPAPLPRSQEEADYDDA